jgi:ATP-dependent Clp endopeptidase proteolytic subunit ClpP
MRIGAKIYYGQKFFPHLTQTYQVHAVNAALASRARRRPIIVNGSKPGEARPWFTFKNEAAQESAEILIYDQIGKTWWDDSGVGAKDFAAELKKIPTDRAITVRINSIGGSVYDGLAIYNQLVARRDKVTTIIDGIAASIASVIALAGKEVQIPKNALMMIHDPSCMAAGNAEDMRKVADALDKHKDIIAAAYESKTGKPIADIKTKMSEETWFTGQEAKDYGLADTLLEQEISISASLSKFDLSSFRRAPKVIENTQQPAAESGGAKPKDNTMRTRIIALLNKHGIKFENSMTDEQLLALLEAHNPTAAATAATGATALPTTVPAQPAAAAAAQAGAIVDLAAFNTLQSNFKTIADRLEVERKTRITTAVNKSVEEARIPADQAERWIGRALTDEAVLNDLSAMPARPPGIEPVAAIVDVTGDNVSDIEKGYKKTQEASASFVRGNNVDPKALHAGAMGAANLFRKFRDKLMFVVNANTIGTDLKRNIILQEIMRAFAKRLMPLRSFSTVFANVPLQGTDKVIVPYFPLETAASTDWVAANGYVMGDSTQNTKDVTVNKRKYQPIRFDSTELMRQPALNLQQIAEIKAEKLASDIFADVLSVITAATYGAAAFTGVASTFDSVDVTDLKGVGDVAEWPDAGRSLVVQSAYDVNLLKDSGVKSALNFGSSDPIQLGKVRQIEGFTYHMCNNIPGNSENLIGFINFVSAVLVALAPIMPDDTVRSQLTRYELVVQPDVGIAFEYRLWGNPDFDQRREVIECNYGYKAGETAALKRMISA